MKIFIGFCACLLALYVLRAPVSKEDPLTKEKIGETVEAAYRNAECIELTANLKEVSISKDGVVSKEGSEATARAFMAKAAFKSLIYNHAGKLIQVVSLDNAVLQEYIPGPEGSGDLVEYTSPFPNGTDNTRSEPDEGCPLAGFAFSWVGVLPNSLDPELGIDYAQYMRRMVDLGEQKPDASERGRDCYVFEESITVFNGVIKNLVFVDKETFFVIRWDCTRPTRKTDHIYTITVLEEVPAGIQWKIDPKRIEKKGDRVGFPSAP